MKRIIIALIILSQGIIIKAQCVNGTSTNPSNPINNQIFGIRPELVNTFNWAEVLSGNALQFYPLQGMNTAFTQNGMINPYNQQNTYSHLVSASVPKRDYHWEDGWEMLSFNLGYYPDGSLISNVPDGFSDPINQEIPYIIFYNRYRGVIRVFFNSLTGITNPFKGVTIKLKFKNNKVSGTFMPAQTILQGLDKETKITEITSYSDHPNNSQKWAHADFQVGYDPCVCIFRSDIEVQFKFISSSTFTMTKREITVEQNLINPDGSINYGKDFFANVGKDNAGLAVYKNLDLMVSNYQTELESVKRQNAAAKEHNQKIGFYKKVLGFATDGLPKVAKKISGLGTWGEDKISSITNGDTLVSAATINKGVKEGLASGLDWLGGEFLSEKPYAANPTMPTAMFTEASYAGEIVSQSETSAAVFYNPGSYSGTSGHWSAGQSVDAFSYPYYNEMMGVFALLETPQIDLKSHSARNDNTTAPPNQSTRYINKKAVKLNKMLNYQFNPALDIKEFDIQAMWVIKVKRDAISSQRHCCPYYEPHKGVQFETVLNVTTLRQVNMTSLDLDEQGGANSLLNTLGKPIDLIFNSVMVPLDKLYDFQPELHFSDAVSGSPLNIEVQLKLIIDVTYNNVGSDGAPTRQLFVQTYAIEDEDITNINNSPSYNGQTVPAYNLNSLTKNLSFSNPTFNGQPVSGCKLVNGKYTCLAKNRIEIVGQINVHNGYNVEFIAGTKIDVDPTTTALNNKIRFRIGGVMKTRPMPEASQSEVTNFCNGSGTQPYKANQSRARSGDFNTPEEEVLLIEKELKISLGIYPNPVTNHTQYINVNYITNINAKTSVYITDLHGRKLINVQSEKQVDNGLYKVPVDISSLTPGIYLCTIIVNNQRKTEKIVVLK